MIIQEANVSWNDRLCKLMYDGSMPANIEIAYTRYPDFFIGLNIQGADNKVFICRNKEKLLLCFTVSNKELYIDGRPVILRYLGGIRIAKEHKAAMAMGKTLYFYRDFAARQKINANFGVIIEENFYVKKMFTAKRPYMPQVYDFGEIITYAVNINKRKKIKLPPQNITIQRGDSVKLKEIVSFLSREGMKKQFFPVYTENYFRRAENFFINDFYVACSGKEILGVTAVWDQGNFKQNLIKAYHGPYKSFKGLFNVILKAGGYKPLPPEGFKLNSFYICFTAIKNNDYKIFKLLLDQIYRDNQQKEYHYFLLGLHKNDRLRDAVKNYFTIPYRSRLYLFGWNDEAGSPGDFIEGINRAPEPYLEIATL